MPPQVHHVWILKICSINIHSVYKSCWISHWPPRRFRWIPYGSVAITQWAAAVASRRSQYSSIVGTSWTAKILFTLLRLPTYRNISSHKTSRLAVLESALSLWRQSLGVWIKSYTWSKLDEYGRRPHPSSVDRFANRHRNKLGRAFCPRRAEWTWNTQGSLLCSC